MFEDIVFSSAVWWVFELFEIELVGV